MIQVVAYDPSWPGRFEALEREYRTALDRAGVAVVAIEHVGEYLGSGTLGEACHRLRHCGCRRRGKRVAEVLGLGFRPLGELGIEQRWAFKEPPRLAGTNTYVTVEGCLSLSNHLRVRDLFALTLA